jgi:hypothetical protein
MDHNQTGRWYTTQQRLKSLCRMPEQVFEALTPSGPQCGRCDDEGPAGRWQPRMFPVGNLDFVPCWSAPNRGVQSNHQLLCDRFHHFSRSISNDVQDIQLHSKRLLIRPYEVLSNVPGPSSGVAQKISNFIVLDQ